VTDGRRLVASIEPETGIKPNFGWGVQNATKFDNGDVALTCRGTVLIAKVVVLLSEAIDRCVGLICLATTSIDTRLNDGHAARCRDLEQLAKVIRSKILEDFAVVPFPLDGQIHPVRVIVQIDVLRVTDRGIEPTVVCYRELMANTSVMSFQPLFQRQTPNPRNQPVGLRFPPVRDAGIKSRLKLIEKRRQELVHVVIQSKGCDFAR